MGSDVSSPNSEAAEFLLEGGNGNLAGKLTIAGFDMVAEMVKRLSADKE